MTKLYRIIGADGFPVHGPWDEAQGPLPDDAEEIERLPEAFEERVNGKWVVIEHEALANWKAGPEHIAAARAQKRIEAMLIKSGVMLESGLLLAEAGERKITVNEMANLVMAKSAEFETTEIDRQKASL